MCWAGRARVHLLVLWCHLGQFHGDLRGCWGSRVGGFAHPFSSVSSLGGVAPGLVLLWGLVARRVGGGGPLSVFIGGLPC